MKVDQEQLIIYDRFFMAKKIKVEDIESIELKEPSSPILYIKLKDGTIRLKNNLIKPDVADKLNNYLNLN